MEHHTVIIIGSGFGGQCAAIGLKKQGINDVVILERRDFMGGTWCQNSYPGAAVDIPSPLYSMEAEPYDWSQMYAEQSELQEYTNYVIDKHKLRDCTRTCNNVKKIQWNDDEKYWHIHVENYQTGEQSEYSAQYIVNASGPLSTPVIPDFKGKDTFKGESFHTNNWNHDFDLSGKKVAIIGSGASAAQVIPTIAPDVAELHIFQRTPHWVVARHDYVFKGWHRKLLRNRLINKVLRSAIYWALEFRVIGFKYSKKLLDIFGTNQARRHLHKQIKDPELRKKITPDFTLGCKRVIISNTLYPTYCRDNVTLHTKEQGIQEITETGIHTKDGEQLDLDLIIYATGYDATDGVISYPVVGRQSKLLSDIWSDYPRAYLGTMIPDFPNLFIVTGPNTGIGHTSALFLIESQLKYILKAIQKSHDTKAKTIEVRAESEEKYTDFIHKEMEKTVWQTGGCNSWYKSKSGKVIAMFPGFSFSYRRLAKNFRDEHHVITR